MVHSWFSPPAAALRFSDVLAIVPAGKEFEETLGVLLLLIRRFLEDHRNLNQSFLAGFTGKVGVPVAGLRLPGEGRNQILFGLSAFQ